MEPRATEHIADIVEMIARLVDKGFAYEVDGDVYFEVKKFPPYGQLSGKNLEELMAGARIEVDHRKKRSHGFCPLEIGQTRRAGMEQSLG